jgi:hypothetical protein
MDYLSEKLGFDEPSEVISLTVDYLEIDFFSFPDMFGFEDERDNIVYELKDMDIKYHNQKLKFAIWNHMDFCMYDLEITNFDEIINMIRDLINKFVSEYIPMTEFFDEDDKN